MKDQIEMNLGEKTLFYHYDQNNSGGSFHYDENLGENVIIEARSPGEADEKFQELGGYFNGVEKGYDCGCCGDRWYRSWRTDEAGLPLDELTKDFEGDPKSEHWWHRHPTQYVVHYLDGRVEWHHREYNFRRRNSKD